MDPNANLEEQLRIARRIVDSEDPDLYYADRLADLVLALDEWIRKGGFLPSAWQEAVKAADAFRKKGGKI